MTNVKYELPTEALENISEGDPRSGKHKLNSFVNVN